MQFASVYTCNIISSPECYCVAMMQITKECLLLVMNTMARTECSKCEAAMGL